MQKSFSDNLPFCLFDTSRMVFRFLIVSLICCAGSLSVVLAQNPGHELRGRVLLESGAPPATSVRVQLLQVGGVPKGQAFTDAAGQYAFARVPNGNYQLIIESDGTTFETTTVDIEIFFFSSRVSQIATRNVTLKFKKGSEALKDYKGSRELDASIPKDAKKEFEKGVKSQKKGASSEAMSHFNEAIKLHPKYFDAHVAVAEEHAKQKDFPAARNSFLQAIEIKPKAAQAFLGLGIVLVKSGDFPDAIAKIRQAMELGDKSATSHLFLGIALMETSADDEAEKMFLKAIDIGANTQPGLRLYLANFYNRRGERKKTLEQLEAYVRDAPSASNVNEIQDLIKTLRDQK